MTVIEVPDIKQHDRSSLRVKSLFQISRQLFDAKGMNILGNILVHHMRENSTQNGYYHDSAHMFAVAIEADEIAVHYELNIETRQALLLAALYHDYGHSYGKRKDIFNIHKAIGHFLDHCEKYDFVNNLQIRQETIPIICNMIMCTHYPFVNEPCNYAASILRDADLLMSIQPDVEYFADGLTREFSNQLLDVIATPEEMYKFAMTQKFYTDYARNKLEAYEKKIKDAWRALFILNCLPWLTLSGKFEIKNNETVVLLALPTTIISCIAFTLPVVLYQVWYEYRLYKKYK